MQPTRPLSSRRRGGGASSSALLGGVGLRAASSSCFATLRLSLLLASAAGVLLSVGVFAEQSDLMLQAICADKCSKTTKGLRECRSACEREPLNKAGKCDNSSTDLFLTVCLAECATDLDCTGLDKCCPHPCGRTCRPPLGLSSIQGLPSVPVNVSLLQVSDMGHLLIDWSHEGGAQYVVEIREGPGGAWTPGVRGPRLYRPVRVPVRAGFEYTARVAAVNRLGSKGFSNPSNPITTHLGPGGLKPPGEPEEVSFKGSLRNGTVSGLLSWRPPSASASASTGIPVSKYSVLWSQRIYPQGAALSKKGSIEQHWKSVPQGKHCVRIKKLQPNSTYSFYVLAHAFYGREKITSKKGITVDTSKFSSLSKRGIKPRGRPFSVHYKVLKTKQQQQQEEGGGGGLNVKISWPAKERTKYAVSWETNCDSRSMSVVSNGSHYTIPDVKRNCTYQVFVREKSDCKKRRKLGKLTFKVP